MLGILIYYSSANTPNFTFIYGFIVHEKYRKQGIGKALWNEMRERTKGQSIELVTGRCHTFFKIIKLNLPSKIAKK